MIAFVRSVAFVVLTSFIGTACAQFQPQVGQAGKDVIWVPTPEEVVDRMLTMAQVTPQDFVVDLGSGDGRTVILAAKKYGARALGVQDNPDLVTLSPDQGQKAGGAARAQVTGAANS